MRRALNRLILIIGLSGCAGGSAEPTAETSAAVSANLPIGYHDCLGLDCGSDPFESLGWALDGDVPDGSVQIDFYIDGAYAGSSFTDRLRTDVNQAYGVTGDHGWRFVIPEAFRTVGTHSLTAYALDDGGTGPNPALTLSPLSYTVSGPVCGNQRCESGEDCLSCAIDCGACPSRAPFGSHDCLGVACGVVDPFESRGWALDLDAPSSSIQVDFYIDGAYAGSSQTDLLRPDVNQVFGVTGSHGWRFVVPQAFRGPGTHSLAAFALDTVGTAGNPLLTLSPQSYAGTQTLPGTTQALFRQSSLLDSGAVDGTVRVVTEGIPEGALSVVIYQMGPQAAEPTSNWAGTASYTGFAVPSPLKLWQRGPTPLALADSGPRTVIQAYGDTIGVLNAPFAHAIPAMGSIDLRPIGIATTWAATAPWSDACSHLDFSFDLAVPSYQMDSDVPYVYAAFLLEEAVLQRSVYLTLQIFDPRGPGSDGPTIDLYSGNMLAMTTFAPGHQYSTVTEGTFHATPWGGLTHFATSISAAQITQMAVDAGPSWSRNAADYRLVQFDIQGEVARTGAGDGAGYVGFSERGLAIDAVHGCP